MNLKKNTQQQMLSFSQFRSRQEFDDQIERWLVEAPNNFTKGELICFQQLLQLSKVVPGVCYQKIDTILVEVEVEQGVQVSRDTFKRMLRKAKARGMLTVHPTVRENGSQTSNLYVLRNQKGEQPYE